MGAGAGVVVVVVAEPPDPQPPAASAARTAKQIQDALSRSLRCAGWELTHTVLRDGSQRSSTRPRNFFVRSSRGLSSTWAGLPSSTTTPWSMNTT